MYGRPQSDIIVVLDGKVTGLVLNGTNPAGGVYLIYYVGNMEDGDHQFRGGLAISGALEIDYFECVVPLLHSVLRTAC